MALKKSLTYLELIIAVFKAIWSPLELFGTFRSYLELLGTFEAISSNLEPFGVILSH